MPRLCDWVIRNIIEGEALFHLVNKVHVYIYKAGQVKAIIYKLLWH